MLHFTWNCKIMVLEYILNYSRTEIHSNFTLNPFCSSKLYTVQACIFRYFDKAEFLRRYLSIVTQLVKFLMMYRTFYIHYSIQRTRWKQMDFILSEMKLASSYKFINIYFNIFLILTSTSTKTFFVGSK